MLKELKTIKERVHQLLIEYPSLRDNDNKLIATVWDRDCKKQGFDIKTITAHQFLKIYSDHKLTIAESIRRDRQLIQKADESLRGKNYKSNQDEGDNVRDNINEI